MCGIAGFFDANRLLNFHSYAGIMKGMTQAILHRGPDGGGHWTDPTKGIALGHTRLSILELSVLGAQPMVTPSGRFVIILNGEIYNHLQLREVICSKFGKQSWRGLSDTETLCAMIDLYGVEGAIKKCTGMFAIALWDMSNEELYLVRDRLGEKPVYYGWQGTPGSKIFLFGSELKALRAHPNFVGDISKQALRTYLRYGNCAGVQSIYEGIYKLEPGSILKLSKGNLTPQIHSYWSGKNVINEGVRSQVGYYDSEIVDHLGSLLVESVSGQMTSDVPLGVFLSGGVDSSLVASLMQSISKAPIKSFSIGFGEDAYNEAPYAKEVAKHLGTDHSELYLASSDAISTIFELGRIYDEPFADSSQIPSQVLSRFARNNVTVALTGDGADELFCGYNRYLLTSSAWQLISRIPLSLRKNIASTILMLPPHILSAVIERSTFLKKWFGSGERLHKGANTLVATSPADLYQRQVSVIFDPEKFIIASEQCSELNLTLENLFSSLGIVEGMMANDMLNYLPNDILAKVDRASMSVGLETRAPFLDHRVVEYAWRLPLDIKIRKTQTGISTKWILRQILYKHVPQYLIERPKAGFGVPISVWLRGPLRSWAEDLLSETRIKHDGFFHPEPIRQLWKEHLSGRFNRQHQLWVILMFQQWLSEQNG